MIREALGVTAHFSMDNLLTESGSQIVINSVPTKIKMLRQIINRIADIVNLLVVLEMFNLVTTIEKQIG